MQVLKDYIISALALMLILYKNSRTIFVLVDASSKEVEAYLKQIRLDRKQHPY